MSTAARKARKRAGIRFEKEPKVGTPLESRSWFSGLVRGPRSSRYEGALGSRSVKKRNAALTARGLPPLDEENGEWS